jgi:ADP-heptose:LPS heptosyltransferase
VPQPARTYTNDNLRILISRQTAIGDVIHGLPVLNALRSAYPAATIGWLVEEKAACLLREHPAIDRLFVVPRRWNRSPISLIRATRMLRKFAPHISIDIQGRTKSALGGWLAGAQRRIGFGDGNAREYSRCFNNELVRTTSSHIIDCNLELLRPMGIPKPKEVKFRLIPTAIERARANSLLANAGLSPPFAILNMGAGWKSKLWRTERYAQVAQHLWNDHGLRSLVTWSGESEQRLANEVAILAACATPAFPTTLRDLAALSEQARLFIGSDTGPLHIAVAVGTPCIGLYGPMPAARNGPYGEVHIAVQKAFYHGPPPARKHARRDLMDAIMTEDVCLACDQILLKTPSQPPNQAA